MFRPIEDLSQDNRLFQTLRIAEAVHEIRHVHDWYDLWLILIGLEILSRNRLHGLGLRIIASASRSQLPDVSIKLLMQP